MQTEPTLALGSTNQQRIEFIALFRQLKRDGHAVTLDETKEQGAVRGVMKIHHYATCRCCKEGKTNG